MTLTQCAEWWGGCCMIIGGFLVSLTIPGLLLWALCSTWIAASNKFRAVCRGESLIFEYRKNRTAFLAWKKEVDGK